MSSLPKDASLDSIKEEISFTQIMLHTLSESSDDYQERKRELDTTLACLERQLKIKERRDLKAQQAISRGPSQGRSSDEVANNTIYQTKRMNSTAHGGKENQGTTIVPSRGGHGLMKMEPRTGNLWKHAPLGVRTNEQRENMGQNQGYSNGELSSTGSSPDQRSEDSFPSLLTMTNRKRPRDSLVSPSSRYGQHEAKSRRTTPSPTLTGPTTPSSTDSLFFPEVIELARAASGDTSADARTLRQTQKEWVRMAKEARIQRETQEREDEEVARKLQEETWTPRPSVQPTSRSYSQALLNPQGFGYRVQPPESPSPAQIFKSDNSEQNNGQGSSSQHAIGTPHWLAAKNPYEQPKIRPGTRPMDIPGAFLNLCESDDDDLQEIKPEAFKANDRQTQAPVDLIDLSGDPFYPFNNPFAADLNVASQYDRTQHVQNPSSLGTNLWATPNQPAWPRTNNPAGISSGMPGSSRAFGYAHQPGLWPGNEDLDEQNRSLHSLSPFDPFSAFNPNVADVQYPDYYRDRYDYITNDPTKTREEMLSLLENIRPDEELPPEDREGTPNGMKYPLMEHQKLGLTWLKNMEEGSNKGGILADDMGLGKTIQALALMISRPSIDPHRKTTLIVGPVALMKQWEREINDKLNGRTHRLSTYVLHGSKRKASWNTLREYDVVLTTFGTLASEFKRKEGWDMKKRANPDARPTKEDPTSLLADECKWYRVIIDEAQCIKNKSTKAAQGACCLQSITRFCMTGTPMMNSVQELFSLIEFLRIKPYNVIEKFNHEFTRPLKSQSQTAKEKAMRKLQALLKAILLRRTKKSKIDGKPILNLPERTTEIQHAIFNEDEQAFYNALETKTQLQFNKYMKAGTVGKNYSNVLVLLLRLRQACCHPHLIQDFGVAANLEVSMHDMIALAKQLAPDVVERIKEQDGFECPVCYDAVENPAIFIPCGHDTCSECFTKISDPAHALAQGVEGVAEVKCPECREKISPQKIIDYTAFKKVWMSDEPGQDGETAINETDVETASDTDSDDDGDDDDSGSSLDGFVIDDDVEDGEETASGEEGEDGHGRGSNPFTKSAYQAKPKKNLKAKHLSKKDIKGKGKAKESKAPRKTLAQLKKEGMRNVKARKKYMRRLERDWEPSAKIDKVCEILERIQSGKGEKTIIFSQFTSLLDLLEVPINRHGYGYKRYDGSMSAQARNQAVIDFTDKPQITIMLVSLKAGNSGLNLVAASQVIILDPFWNPYIEEQAIDRAHRIGQLRPVQVHRILVQETVEDRIIKLQEQKRELIEGALDEKASQSIGRLGERELAYLFGVEHHRR
ncbi:MAG: hypothetical protein M1827_001345 [Pycnora praestabilis]|nr:MAG: hypothetical protein M1827_001345 [Pycnora praestabilis]